MDAHLMDRISGTAAVQFQRMCRLCGGNQLSFLLHVPDAHFSKQIRSFDIVRCGRCGLSQMDPFPDAKQIEEIYVAENAFSNVPTDTSNRQRFGARLFEPLYSRHGLYYRYIARKCLQLAQPNEPLKILDVGCSTGRLLTEFAALAPAADVRGIDIDPLAKEKNAPALRDRILIGHFLDQEFADQFDVITFCFVIEHLPDVDRYIERAQSLLKPGGVLFYSSPDIDSAKARQLQERWRLINDPINKHGHVLWFNQRSAYFLAEKHGLEVIHYKNRGEFFYQLPVAIQRLFESIFGSVQSPNGEKRPIRNYQLRLCYALLFDAWLSERFSWGESFFLFARKPA